jgi:hypothetical protein
VKLDGAPYAVAVMVTYGNAGAAEVVRQLSAAAFGHFTQVAGATTLGARVPPALIKRPGL